MPRENLHDLLAFVAVARERSFTRAAAQLGISQSTLRDLKKGAKETQVRVEGLAAAMPTFLAQKSGHFIATSSVAGLKASTLRPSTRNCSRPSATSRRPAQ